MPPTNKIRGGGILESADGRAGGCEMLCLKLLPQFLNHLNETCYT